MEKLNLKGTELMSTVLFFTPHQDDETITMGAAIRHHLEYGHDVYVVLMTDGGASGARAKTGLNVYDFIDARVDEMTRACRQLGVQFDNVILASPLANDGQLTADLAQEIINDAIYYIGGTDIKLKTLSDVNLSVRHPDHIAAGQGLRRFTGQYDIKFYVEPYNLTAVKNTGKIVGTENCATPTAVKNAVNEYKTVDHVADKYGIGNLSVSADLTITYNNPVSYYHS